MVGLWLSRLCKLLSGLAAATLRSLLTCRYSSPTKPIGDVRNYLLIIIGDFNVFADWSRILALACSVLASRLSSLEALSLRH